MKKGILLQCVPGDSEEERFATAKKCGFEGVEIQTVTDPAERKKYRAMADASGVPIVSIMNAGHWSNPLSSPDPAFRERGRAGIVASIETAVAVGANTVLVVPACVSPDVTYEQAYERSMTELNRILPIAERAKITLAIENVWNRFLLSPMEFTEYVDAFGSEYLQAYFDVGNIVAYGFPQHWIRTLGSRINKVHVKGFNCDTHEFTQLLAGTINWAEVMKAFREIGYDGYVIGELGPEGEPQAGIRRIGDELETIITM